MTALLLLLVIAVAFGLAKMIAAGIVALGDLWFDRDFSKQIEREAIVAAARIDADQVNLRG